ncbi:MAG TPA: mechanosensitive ion channel domain-containing protein [Terriglobales bacterium]|nr:mechanosensitive ion channel domain-containing protein [Terriglobales bacterium]
MEELVRKWMYDPTVGKLVSALVGIALVYAVVRFLQRSVSRYVQESETRYRARKFISFLGYAAGILLLTGIFSERFGQLTVAFGVAGAGIAFALQEVIASIAGWVALSFGGFYRPGDRVQLGGIRGDVIDIGVLRTTLMECGQWVNGDLYNGRIVRIANSFVFKEPVFNYSADFPFLWDEIKIPVRYGSDWEYARKVFAQVVDEICRDYALHSRVAWEETSKKYQLEQAGIEPMITLAANDNWIEFTARYIVDYRKRRYVRDRLFTRLLEEVDRSGNRVRLASATLELTNLPRLDVKFSAGKGSVDPQYVP